MEKENLCGDTIGLVTASVLDMLLKLSDVDCLEVSKSLLKLSEQILINFSTQNELVMQCLLKCFLQISILQPQTISSWVLDIKKVTFDWVMKGDVGTKTLSLEIWNSILHTAFEQPDDMGTNTMLDHFPELLRINLELFDYLWGHLDQWTKLHESVTNCMYWMLQMVDTSMVNSLTNMIHEHIESTQMSDAATGILIFSSTVHALPQEMVTEKFIKCFPKIWAFIKSDLAVLRTHALLLVLKISEKYVQILSNKIIFDLITPILQICLTDKGKTCIDSARILTNLVKQLTPAEAQNFKEPLETLGISTLGILLKNSNEDKFDEERRVLILFLCKLIDSLSLIPENDMTQWYQMFSDVINSKFPANP